MDKIKPGRYIVAVSGGVDSMVLLDMLRRNEQLALVVAHVNHGVRDDAGADESLVAAFAQQYRLPYIATQLHLGSGASEEAARSARYDFLRRCCSKYKAAGIIMAHHQDDLIETALLAIMRGTGWRGIAPFVGKSDVLRPLITTPKWQLVAYARKHHIPWHEDSTNTDESYTRNYIRYTLMPMLDQKSDIWREVFLQHIREQQLLRRTIEVSLTDLGMDHGLARYQLIMLPAEVAYEFFQQVLRHRTGNSLPRPLAEAALLFAKTAKPHKIMQLGNAWQLRTTLRSLIVELRTP